MEINDKITLQDLEDKEACEKDREWLYTELKLIGEYIYVYGNGKVLGKCFYEGVIRDGIRIWYTEDLSIYAIEKYNNGKLIERIYGTKTLNYQEIIEKYFKNNIINKRKGV